jgi:dGTPase
VRSGLLTLDQLAGVKIFARHMKAVLRDYPKIEPRRLRHETVRRMIDTLVTDLVRASAENIRRHAPGSIEDVRRAPALIAFSTRIRDDSLELKRFLRENLYRHFRVVRMSAKAKRMVSDLFQAFHADIRMLPPEFQARARDDTPRAIADYIAGMTDRYAMLEHRRIFAIDAT